MNATAQTAEPILTDAAVIDLTALAVELGIMTRAEAVAHLASIDLSMGAFAERLRVFAPRTLNCGASHIITMCDLEIERRIASGDGAAVDAILEIKALAAALDKI